jgi:hypothetical protein
LHSPLCLFSSLMISFASMESLSLASLIWHIKHRSGAIYLLVTINKYLEVSTQEFIFAIKYNEPRTKNKEKNIELYIQWRKPNCWIESTTLFIKLVLELASSKKSENRHAQNQLMN